MTHKVGPKEQQRIDLRLKRYQERGPGAKRTTTEAPASKPINAPVQASAPPQEKTMKKRKAKKLKAVSTGKADHFKIAGLKRAKKRSRSEASANLKAAKAKAPKTSKPKAARTTVPALEVAAFMARPVGATPGSPGGASMDELVAEFGIEAHPMRAKIHYVRHKLGWTVETKDGRYHATEPKGGVMGDKIIKAYVERRLREGGGASLEQIWRDAREAFPFRVPTFSYISRIAKQYDESEFEQESEG